MAGDRNIKFEQHVLDAFDGHEVDTGLLCQISIAISLKRIADLMAGTVEQVDFEKHAWRQTKS